MVVVRAGHERTGAGRVAYREEKRNTHVLQLLVDLHPAYARLTNEIRVLSYDDQDRLCSAMICTYRE